MKGLLSFIAMGSLFIIAACGGGADGDVQQLADACTSSGNLAPELCECVASKAKEDLTEDGFAMLLAMLNEDQETAAELRGKLAMDDVMAAGMFMTSAPSLCMGEPEGS